MRNNLLSGTVGGFVGTVLNTPYVRSDPKSLSLAFILTWSLISSFVRSFDVVKSRIQGATKVPGVALKYNWSYPA